MAIEEVLAELVRHGFSASEPAAGNSAFGDRQIILFRAGTILRLISDRSQLSIWIKIESGEEMDLTDVLRASELCGLAPESCSRLLTTAVLGLAENIDELESLAKRPELKAAIKALWSKRVDSLFPAKPKSGIKP